MEMADQPVEPGARAKKRRGGNGGSGGGGGGQRRQRGWGAGDEYEALHHGVDIQNEPSPAPSA